MTDLRLPPASQADGGDLGWPAFRAARARFLARLARQSALIQLESAWGASPVEGGLPRPAVEAHAPQQQVTGWP